MTPYSAFMLGAATNTYGTNLANFWVYNPENYKFEDIKRWAYRLDISTYLLFKLYLHIYYLRICPGLSLPSTCGATGPPSRGRQTSAPSPTAWRRGPTLPWAGAAQTG